MGDRRKQALRVQFGGKLGAPPPLEVGEAMIVADSITSFVGYAVRTRWGAKPSVCHRLPHVQRTWATRLIGCVFDAVVRFLMDGCGLVHYYSDLGLPSFCVGFVHSLSVSPDYTWG